MSEHKTAASDQTEILFQKIKDLMEEHIPLKEDEIKALKEILDYREEIISEFQYRRARRLLIKESRALIISIAAALATILALRDNIKELFTWMFGN